MLRISNENDLGQAVAIIATECQFLLRKEVIL
jgi:hypothetical protein